MRLAPVIFLLSLLTACEPFGPGAGDTDPRHDPGEGHLVIEISSIDFDVLSVISDPVAQNSIVIRNSGTGELKVAGMDRVIGDDEAFSTNAPALMIIPAGETEDVNIYFHPNTSGLFEGLLFPNGKVSIELTGNGTAPVAELSPLEPEFSDIAVGCEETIQVNLTNLGDERLDILDVYVDGSPSYSVSEVTEDYLEPNEAATMPITYSPIDGGINAATLIIQTNDPLTPTSIASLTAVGYKGSLVEQAEVYNASSDINENGWGVWGLLETPVASTLEVSSSGASISEWTYNDDENTIAIDIAATTITMGDDILFAYLSEVSCE